MDVPTVSIFADEVRGLREDGSEFIRVLSVMVSIFADEVRGLRGPRNYPEISPES